MSFSAQTKTELCAIPVSRDCCAVAEAYGLLLFAHTFSHTEIAVVTANEALAKRVPPLLTRAFSASVQSQEKGAGGRVTLKITEEKQLRRIFSKLGYDWQYHMTYHLNRNIIEDGCCRCCIFARRFSGGGNGRRTGQENPSGAGDFAPCAVPRSDELAAGYECESQICHAQDGLAAVLEG